jgi:hypothetical protein
VVSAYTGNCTECSLLGSSGNLYTQMQDGEKLVSIHTLEGSESQLAKGALRMETMKCKLVKVYCIESQ